MTDEARDPEVRVMTDPAPTRAPRWQRFVTPPAVVVAVLGFAMLAAMFGHAMAREMGHGARGGILLLEVLPLVPPVLGAVLGARSGLRHGPCLTALCYAALGTLLGLAIVAVILYGIFAIVAVTLAHTTG